ncbi:MAG TPA: ABC transporter permease, partial [Methylomirabilota bacterium]|nr:ABC transporter permease [Methylomirabilota bacterium]
AGEPSRVPPAGGNRHGARQVSSGGGRMNLLAELREGLLIALDAIRANKLRSLLTTLGIVIGVVTVTLMGTAIDGLNRAFLNSVSVLGADVLHVDRFSWFIRTRQEWLKAQSRREITLDQVRALERELTLARAVAPVATIRSPVSRKNRRSDGVTVVGTTEQFLHTGGMSVALGRFLSPEETGGGRPVCVLGTEVATNLFQGDPPLGQTVRVGPHKFEVVGVLARQGSFMGEFSLDNQVIIPVRQLVASFWSNPSFQIQVKALTPEQIDELKEEVRGVLRKIRKVPPGDEDDFSINQQEALLAAFYRVAGTIAAVGLFITGLSLFVGGIGIMNIMFVSVAERTREIGVRKAIGARRRAILVQFLIEAAAICGLGGLIAVAIAWPLTLLLQQALPARLSLPVVGVALGVSLCTGVVSGFLPAWRASRLNPVDALRSE